jgi:polyferredoxin
LLKHHGFEVVTANVPAESLRLAQAHWTMSFRISGLAPRFWCRYLCPLGAFLSFVSPLGLFKRRVSPECNECLKCQKACPMGRFGT